MEAVQMKTGPDFLRAVDETVTRGPFQADWESLRG